MTVFVRNQSLYIKAKGRWVFAIGFWRIGFVKRVNGRTRGFDAVPGRIARYS